MRNLNKTILALATVALLASCGKDDVTNSSSSTFSDVDNFEDMKVPSSFKFSTARTVNYNLNLAEAPTSEKYRIDFYTYLPEAGGELIQSTYANGKSNASGDLKVPAYTTNLYVKVNAPDGSSSLYIINAKSTSASASLFAGKKSTKTAPVSPDCNTGCAQSYNNHSSNMNINNNDPGGVYCLTGNHTGNINVNRGGVTLRFCGNAVVSRIRLNQGSSLEVVDGATLEVTDLSINSQVGTATVFGNASLILPNSFNISGVVTNYGSLDVGSNLIVSGNGTLENSGILTVGVDLNQNGIFNNNNSTTIGDDFNSNGGSNTTNNCKLIAMDDININGIFTNHNYSYAGDEFSVQGGADVTFVDGAMLLANRTTVNTMVKGQGSTSLLKLEQTNAPTSSNALNTRINGGGGFQGNIELCDPNGIETNNGSFTNGAAQGCGLYIPTSSCNTEGNGTPAIQDIDGDGAADNVDEYPNDPARASNDYYPSQNSFGTLAYEDLWPALGDYDFNDLVIDYNYTIVKSATNEVVDVKAKYVARANGGGFTNGFGIQFDADQSAVGSVTGQVLTENLINNRGNGTEVGDNDAVVVVFDNTNSVLTNNGTEFTNTIPSEAYSTPDTTNITVTFSTPQTLANLGVAPFNPFLIADVENGRGKEVHLPGLAPTAAANQNLFGSGEDDTNGSSKFYQTTGNLPWALDVVTGFDYPQERVDIVTVYNNFATWAQSGGAQNNDWFVNLPGNILQSNVYQEP